MARSDFNFFHFGALDPTYTSNLQNADIPAGGGSWTLHAHPQAGAVNSIQGYMYNGQTFANVGSKSPMASVAIKTQGDMGLQGQASGLILNSPILFGDNVEIGSANRNFYALGVAAAETTGPSNVRLWRHLGGVQTHLAVTSAPVVSNNFVQFAAIMSAGGGVVNIWYSYNGGTSISRPTPGSNGWSAASLLYSDVGHGGILLGDCYYGFGNIGHYLAWADPTAGCFFDNFRIEQYP